MQEDEPQTGEEAAAAAAPAPSPPAPNQPAPYVAIVHFHGMGSQRRLEETSRLIDALDSFQYSEFKAGRPLGLFRKIEPRLIPPGDDGAEPDVYIRATLLPPNDAPARNFRFHEAYWAPIMAEETSALGIVWWVLAQWRRPFQTLFTPWRQRQRLRRASLIDQFENHARTLPPQHEESDLDSLISLYDDFESPQSRRIGSRGHFSDFLRFIESKNRNSPKRSARLQAVARAWRRHYVRSELFILFLLTTLVLAIALAVGAVLLAALAIAGSISGTAAASPTLAGLVELLGGRPGIAVLLATGLVTLSGLTGFLTDALGDVRAWASYRETDLGNRKRQEILTAARRTMARVLNDPFCERVVVTAHSLGTTIAHDTLLSLTRANRAHNRENPIEGPLPLRKIEHFVTMGSPIDKVEYFFESSTSTSHRYLRVQEILRGDTGGPPFAHNRKPHIHWINFWDDADLVSGPLSSPMPAQRSLNPIDNFHVKGFAFPLPAASHTRYLSHRAVVAHLWTIIIDGGLRFSTLQTVQGAGKPYGDALIRPGKGKGERRWVHLLAVALPWVILASLLLHRFAGLTVRPLLATALLLVGLLALLALKSAREGPLDPF